MRRTLNNLKRFAVIVGLLCMPFAGNAQDSEQFKKWFERAEQIAHRPNGSEYKFLRKKLKDYPLWPYIEQKTLLRYPYISNEKKIATFLEQHGGTVLDRPLRKKWLNHLVRQKRPDIFLKYYKDIDDTALKCRYLEFQIADGQPSEVQLDELQQLWVVGKSQPNECDTVFSAWLRSGRLNDEVVLDRMALAADGGSSTLIPYLKSLLPDNKKYLGDRWLAVRRSPSRLTKFSKFTGEFPEHEARILTYGLQRLIWRSPELALKTWPKALNEFQFSTEQKRSIARRFAIALAAKNHKEANKWLKKATVDAADEELFRWYLTQILREQDWHKVQEVIRLHPELLEKELIYPYWQARSYELLGKKDVADAIFLNLAKQRHYYGFLASGKQDRDISLVNKPLIPNQSSRDAVMAIPAVQRAKAFLELGRKASARREWRDYRRSANKTQMSIAAVLASEWEWHDQAIHTFSDSGYLDDVKRRFPLAYKNDLVKNAKQVGIEPAWAFAITRRESSFLEDAHSSAGARGLMQLLPSTVNYIEKKKHKQKKLYNAQFNVEMGTKYMRYLMDKMDNNPVLVTASYNAGWRRVRGWVPKGDSLPLDVWVETIPFKETRNYVKAVLAYKQIYLQQLGGSENYFLDYANMFIGDTPPAL